VFKNLHNFQSKSCFTESREEESIICAFHAFGGRTLKVVATGKLRGLVTHSKSDSKVRFDSE